MPRKTESNSPADWLLIAGSDLEGVPDLASRELAYAMYVSKHAEILEGVLKAELIRSCWFLSKTNDLVKLVDKLRERDPRTASSHFVKNWQSAIFQPVSRLRSRRRRLAEAALPGRANRRVARDRPEANPPECFVMLIGRRTALGSGNRCFRNLDASDPSSGISEPSQGTTGSLRRRSLNILESQWTGGSMR